METMFKDGNGDRSTGKHSKPERLPSYDCTLPKQYLPHAACTERWWLFAHDEQVFAYCSQGLVHCGAERFVQL
jgi:hypothetical protein